MNLLGLASCYFRFEWGLVLWAWLGAEASAQSIWIEGWQGAEVRKYIITDGTEDGISGDRGGWVVYDSAPDCGGAPHANTAEIVLAGTNKTLKMTVVPNDCVTDLSVDLFSSPNIPIATNTLISFAQTGALVNPSWNGFFPTLFPPPGNNIRLFLLDQNKNALVYIFQRPPDYPNHTTTLQVEFPDGHVGPAGYREVFVDSYNAPGSTYLLNLFQDFNKVPGFKPSQAQVSYISLSISGVGTATFDNVKIGPGIAATAPTITSQPVSHTVTAGSPTTLEAKASGTQPIAFRWWHAGTNLLDGTLYSGTTTAILTITNASRLHAGTYTAVASNAKGSVNSAVATLTVSTNPASATVILGNLSQIYDGSAKSISVTTTPPGIQVNVTYNGSPDAPTNAGTYVVIGVASPPGYIGGATNTLVINKAMAAVLLDNLVQNFDGTPKSVTVTTTPLGLPISMTYNGSANPPTAAGTYTVVGTVSDRNYQGAGTATLLIAVAQDVVLSNLAQSNNFSAAFDSRGAGLLFHTGSSTNWQFDKVSLLLGGPGRWGDVGTGGITYNVLIYGSSNNVPAGLVGSYSPVTVSDPGLWNTNVTFTSPSPIVLAPNTDYWLAAQAITSRPGGIWEGSSSPLYVSNQGFSLGDSYLNPASGPSASRLDGWHLFVEMRAWPAQPMATSPTLSQPLTLSGGFQFGFSSAPGARFRILATTNLSLSITDWLLMGGPTETSPGRFQFTDPAATNSERRFYRAVAP